MFHLQREKGSNVGKSFKRKRAVFKLGSQRVLKCITRRLNSQGLTLIEVMAVVVILAIVAGISVPSVVGAIDRAKEDVCQVNKVNVERGYETHLILEDVEHNEERFTGYLRGLDDEFCPDDGEITYVDGQVECSVHSGDHGEPEEVPHI